MIRALQHVCRCTKFRSALISCAVGLALVAIAGCGELEPMVEPEVADLQLTIDTLKTQVRDSQRAMTELRAELDARRQDLAEAQVAKAQLEGRVREAERRVAEARHVIDLQREELVAARAEREHLSRSSLQLQSQVRKLQKHLSKAGPPLGSGQGAAPASFDGPGLNSQEGGARVSADTSADSSSRILATPTALPDMSPVEDGSRESHNSPDASLRAVSVKPGDTLWSIAQRYHVNLTRLRSLNHLTDNRIIVGQALWVPADRAVREAAMGNATNP